MGVVGLGVGVGFPLPPGSVVTCEAAVVGPAVGGGLYSEQNGRTRLSCGISVLEL